jgi:hypothetical protein
VLAHSSGASQHVTLGRQRRCVQPPLEILPATTQYSTATNEPPAEPGQAPLPSFGRLTEIIRDESELNDVIDDALFWVGMRGGVVGLVAVAFSNEVGTITTLSKCSSKLAMLTGNGQCTLAVR